MGHAIPAAPATRVMIADVKAAAAEFGGITEGELEGSRGDRHVITIRHSALLVALRITGRSTTAIGQAFGRRDHSTVVMARKKMEGLIVSDPAMKAAVELIERAAILRAQQKRGAAE